MKYGCLKPLLCSACTLVSYFCFAGQEIQSNSDYIRVEVLSGMEAQIVKKAVERFNSEKLNITPHGYDISIYFNNGNYVVFFNRAKNASPGTIDPSYEVVISGETLNVVHSQFYR